MSSEQRRKQLSAYIEKQEIEAGHRVGYWLVREIDGQRFYISKQASESALQKICDKALSETKGWGYWIDYCLGHDVHGAVAWVNVDQTDRFI